MKHGWREWQLPSHSEGTGPVDLIWKWLHNHTLMSWWRHMQVSSTRGQHHDLLCFSLLARPRKPLGPTWWRWEGQWTLLPQPWLWRCACWRSSSPPLCSKHVDASPSAARYQIWMDSKLEIQYLQQRYSYSNRKEFYSKDWRINNAIYSQKVWWPLEIPTTPPAAQWSLPDVSQIPSGS